MSTPKLVVSRHVPPGSVFMVSSQLAERTKPDSKAFAQWADAALDAMLKSVYTQPLLDDIERGLASDEQAKSAHFEVRDARVEAISADDLTIYADEDDDVLDHDEYQRLLGLWRMARDGSGTAPAIATEARVQLKALLTKHALTVSVHAVCKCATIDDLATALAPSMVEKSTVDDHGGRFGSRVTGGPAVDAGLKSAFVNNALRT